MAGLGTLLLPATLLVAAVETQGPPAAGGRRPLPFADEASRCPGFQDFREHLNETVRHKDANALLAIVHPDIRFSFGPENGRDAFRQRWIEGSQDGDVWLELEQLVRLGGRCEEGRSFVTPYVFADWPEDLDAFEHGAVTGTRVRLREAPGLAAPVLSWLDYEIVRVSDWGDGTSPWVAVATFDGRKGFAARRYVRSPVGIRAYFTRDGGAWRMTLFVQGD